MHDRFLAEGMVPKILGLAQSGHQGIALCLSGQGHRRAADASRSQVGVLPSPPEAPVSDKLEQKEVG